MGKQRKNISSKIWNETRVVTTSTLCIVLEVLAKVIRDIFHRTRKKSKNSMKTQRPCRAKAILSRKNTAEGIAISDLKLFCGATVTKTAWYLHKIRYAD